jgi:hypothetical protein
VNAPEVLTVFITLGVFMLGSVLALIFWIGTRLDKLDDHVQLLREDVAVLKATR